MWQQPNSGTPQNPYTPLMVILQTNSSTVWCSPRLNDLHNTKYPNLFSDFIIF